jgi:hypothetical protein
LTGCYCWECSDSIIEQFIQIGHVTWFAECTELISASFHEVTHVIWQEYKSSMSFDSFIWYTHRTQKEIQEKLNIGSLSYWAAMTIRSSINGYVSLCNSTIFVPPSRKLYLFQRLNVCSVIVSAQICIGQSSVITSRISFLVFLFKGTTILFLGIPYFCWFALLYATYAFYWNNSQVWYRQT